MMHELQTERAPVEQVFSKHPTYRHDLVHVGLGRCVRPPGNGERQWFL